MCRMEFSWWMAAGVGLIFLILTLVTCCYLRNRMCRLRDMETKLMSNPAFFEKLDKLVDLNAEVIEAGKSGNTLGKFLTIGKMAVIIISFFFMTPKKTGSYTFEENKSDKEGGDVVLQY